MNFCNRTVGTATKLMKCTFSSDFGVCLFSNDGMMLFEECIFFGITNLAENFDFMMFVDCTFIECKMIPPECRMHRCTVINKNN